MNLHYLGYLERLQVELLQSADEGKNMDKYIEKVGEIEKLEETEKEIEGCKLLKEILSEDTIGSSHYKEPSDIGQIRDNRPSGPRKIAVESTEKDLYDKILGAWLGRCSGCLLGQPIEGWYRDRIEGFAKASNNYPVNYYMSSDVSDDIKEKYNVSDEGSVYGSKNINWINNVDHMVEDDDTNYTILSLAILEKYGRDFTT